MYQKRCWISRISRSRPAKPNTTGNTSTSFERTTTFASSKLSRTQLVFTKSGRARSSTYFLHKQNPVTFKDSLPSPKSRMRQMQIRQRDNLQRTSWKLLTDRLASTKGVLLVLGLLFFLFFFTVRSSGSRSNTQLFTTQRNAHVTPAHSITRRICTPCQGYPYTLKHQLVTHKPAPTT